MSKTKNTLLIVLAAGVLLVGADIVAHTADTIPEAHAETVRTTKKTRVMARPGEKSRVLTRISSGQKLKVLAKKGRWIKVRANGRTGWITRTSVASTAQARKPVRRTRRRAFVEGRSTRRGFSGSAPADRVGADATDDEAMLDDDEELLEDEPKRSAARSKKRTARKSKKKSKKREARRDDFEDEELEDDFVDEEEAPAVKTVVVKVRETELMAEPSSRAEGVVFVDKGQKLEVIDRDGDWILVANADGDEGWIRSDEIESGGFTYPKMLKRGSAGLGYTSLGSIFASDGQGELANYKFSTAAAALSVGGDVLYRYSDKYILGGDARYTGTRANPGIRFVNEAGDAADIAFTMHEVSVGASAGYNLKNKSGTVVYARAGYYYGKTSIANVGDFEQNLAYLPSEILSGITVGARVHMPMLTPKIGVKVSVDALYPNGTRQQTAGLEDGAVSSVFAAWAVGHLAYQWKPNLTIDAIYRYAYSKTEWTGAAEGSMRPHNATEAARKDVGHTAMIGLGRNF